MFQYTQMSNVVPDVPVLDGSVTINNDINSDNTYRISNPYLNIYEQLIQVQMDIDNTNDTKS